MYLLSADGRRVPQLARHFGRCEVTMRRWIRQFKEEGLKAVRHKQLGTGPDRERCQSEYIAQPSHGTSLSMMPELHQHGRLRAVLLGSRSPSRFTPLSYRTMV